MTSGQGNCTLSDDDDMPRAGDKLRGSVFEMLYLNITV